MLTFFPLVNFCQRTLSSRPTPPKVQRSDPKRKVLIILRKFRAPALAEETPQFPGPGTLLGDLLGPGAFRRFGLLGG